MTQDGCKTPEKAVCNIPKCNKTLKNKKNLTSHMEKVHRVVTAISESPLATTVRTLFTSDAQQSTQGDSSGAVNSPKVRSEGRYLCGECDKGYKTQLEAKEHVKTHNEAIIIADNDSIIEDDEQTAQELGNLANILETDMASKEAENINLRNMVTIDSIVDNFVDNAYKAMNPSNETSTVECHECVCKDENLVKYDKMLDEKEAIIVEKLAAVAGLVQKVKTLTDEKAVTSKKLKETEDLKKALSEKNKTISNLKAEIQTKDGMLAIAREKAANKAQDESDDEIVIEIEVKKCKKCNFTATNMQVLGLHMENDHAYNFQCEECGKKFPFKNQLKLHKREVHKEGSFSCFVCNKNFITHKDLKLHIQKKCKTGNTSSQTQFIHKHNDDIMKEDEHKCPMCPKITNNQVSLINHINTKHKANMEKCDACEKDFESKEVLIKHIVETHTNKGQQIITRHVCQICNVEVHGDQTRDNHQCRKPEHTCSFCKVKLYSQEARRNHICNEHEFKTVAEQFRAQKRKQTECTHGPNCFRAQRNRCWFKHSQPLNSVPHRVQVQEVRQGHDLRPQGQQGQGLPGQGQQGHGQPGQGQQWHVQRGHGRRGEGQQVKELFYCKFQERCFKGISCKYKHFQQNFQEISLNHNNQ